MPKSTREHALERESRIAFEGAVPSRWVYRRKDADDYGVDGEVEIFDTDGKATGLHFNVQLKATDEVKLSKALARSIPLDHASYYRSLTLPVLMVRYVAIDNALYTRWFHSHDSYGAKRDRKSLTFRWNPEDVWAESRPEELIAQTRAFLELRSSSPQLPMQFAMDVDAPLEWTLSDDEVEIAIRTAGSLRPDIVVVASNDPSPGSGRLLVRPDRIAVEVARVTAATLHIDGSYEPGRNGEQLGRDVFALMALAFEHAGQAGIAGRLATTFLPASSLVPHPEALWALSAAMSRSRMVREALDLSETFDIDDDSDAREASYSFTFPALANAATLTLEEIRRYREVGVARIQRREEARDHVAAAREYHNLANHYRAQGEPAEALRRYERAAELDAKYLHRAHHWNERAGVLFGLERYQEATDAYDRAIELGANGWPYVLRADSLLFAGRYEEALNGFRAWNEEQADLGRAYEWVIKEMVAADIVEEHGITSQMRDPEAARRVTGEAINAAPPLSDEEVRSVADRALGFDALEPYTWFTLGAAEDKLSERDAAEQAFLAAAVLSEWDAEAWAFTFVFAALGEAPPEHIVGLMSTGQRLTGGRMVPQILDLIRGIDDENFPREHLRAVVNGVLADLPKEPDGFEMRLLGDDGSIESIEVPGADRMHGGPAGDAPEEAAGPGKVGRNQPCPCGSGKKYKKCHGTA